MRKKKLSNKRKYKKRFKTVGVEMAFLRTAENAETIQILITAITFTPKVSPWQGRGVETNPDYSNCGQDDNGLMYVKRSCKSLKIPTNNPM